MPLSWPWITLPCPGQQLFCTDKEMAESVHPPKNCCLKPPDLRVRGLSSCYETALLMPPLSPSCWPGSQEEVALGQRMLWEHLVCPSPAASQKSRRECTNCASTCNCVNKSSAFLFPGTAFPAITSGAGEPGELPALHQIHLYPLPDAAPTWEELGSAPKHRCQDH